MSPATVSAVLTDWQSAPVSKQLRAALGFLEKNTLDPAEVTSEDAREVLEAGVPPEGIEELLYVCFLFNVLDRLADAFDFEMPSEKGGSRIGFLAYHLGYGIAKLPG